MHGRNHAMDVLAAHTLDHNNRISAHSRLRSGSWKVFTGRTFIMEVALVWWDWWSDLCGLGRLLPARSSGDFVGVEWPADDPCPMVELSNYPTCTHPAMHTNTHNPIQMAGLESVSLVTIEWITYPSSEF